MALYGLRWRIENIFKTWKSNFSFGKVHTVSEQQLRVLLTA
jgi:IS4 transposase